MSNKQKQSWFMQSFLFIVLSAYLNLAWAHGNTSGLMRFSEGFVHPWLGVDHLAMVFTVAVWARSSSAKQLWQLACCFLLAMTIGFHLPLQSTELAESSITALLVFTGLALMSQQKLSIQYVWPLFGFAGYSHGSVHADVMVANGENTIAFIGLLFATAIIQLLGIVAGRQIQQLPRLQMATGFACVLIGTVLA